MPGVRLQYQEDQTSKAHSGEPSWKTRPPEPHLAIPPSCPSGSLHAILCFRRIREAYPRVRTEKQRNAAGPRRILIFSVTSPASRPRLLTACPTTGASARPHHMPSANCHSSKNLTSRPRQAGAQWHHLPCAWLWKTFWRSLEVIAALGRERGCWRLSVDS